ncbi:FecR family protein [Arsenicibacter rosenii]|uniref:Iron dicitrate transport regulator FecR n=1 Tax=Arsenicibacter rosenii TaxID=1750698 RepID=A0A1S2VDY6_9BACT|nr:FecR domain-containing protein [Arsenicibacter rosenii]OIN56128.1 iron dicitrate transport regulator FecR [Arsenicibacter rosenii]
MESEVNKELIFSHFERNTSPLQRELIASWLQTPAHEEQYYEWLEEWEMTHPQYLARTEEAVAKFTGFMASNQHAGAPGHETTTVPVVRTWPVRQWLVAASVLLLLAPCAWLLRKPVMYQTYTTAYGETRPIQLADGSKVMLSANSSLRVPRWGFGVRTREVELAGEASFSIVHTPDDQTFAVKTANNVTVVVLGTEFSVFARKRGARVQLNKGKVQLNYQQGRSTRQLTMKPGDLVTLDRQNRMQLRNAGHSLPGIISTDKRFVFDETSLQEVAYLLEDNYGLEVTISDQALAERVLMGSFRADNVDQLLQSISELLDITVVRQGNKVRISDQ